MLFRDHGHRHFNTRAVGSDAFAVFVAFLVIVASAMGAFVWFLSDYLIMPVMVLFSVIIGGTVSGIFGIRLAIRREAEAVEAVRERQRNKEAETQKQIDAMLRGNSKIPKVKR